MMIVLMMGTVSVLPTFSADEDPSRRGPSPVAEGVPWIDSLDDLSHVYVPTGGLVGVEVGGGDAHLKSGAQTGWLASETLTSSPGYYYDQVVLEVDAPGDSRVLVSILDASAEPDEVGFANGTIGAYKLRGELDLVLVALSPDLYPSIRIQVSLEASGTDLPRLLSWSLFFTSRGEWRDDFRGPSKIVEQNHINFTGEALEVDLSKPAIGGPGVGEYDPYPTIAMAEGTTAAFLYPDAGHTSYQDELIPFRDFASAVTIHDLDLDGYLDLVIANSSDDSAIYWGDPSGVFSPSKKQVLDTESARNVAVGDFNGDGWPDIIFAEISKAVVFTNDGGGTIPDQPDVTISSPTQSAFVGDFDGDSYEDVLLTYSDGSIYHGGPQGLSPTESVTLPGSFWTVADLDKDGRSDVVAYDTSTGLNVFLGGTSGIDTVADYTLTVDNTAYYPTTGDMNGDGYVDIVVNDHQGAGVYAIKAFEGDATGWSSDRTHVLTTGPWSRLVAGDVDKDGSDDLLYTKFESPSFRMEIYGGGGTWNFTRFTQKNLTRNVVDTAIAVPRGGNLPRAYRGILTTVPITVPQDRKWDVVHLDGTFPSNTSTRVSVLDGTSGRVMTGYKDLPTLNVDLSDIDPSAHRTISLKVTILTDVNTTTPVLDSLSVEWLSVREWRDEFYGPNRVDGVLNIVPSGGSLHRGAIGGSGPQLVFPSLLGDDNYTTTATAYFDDGGADYLARTPLDFRVRGAVDADAADVNGDGYMDIAFAVHQADEVTFATTSPLILGGPLGLEGSPSHGFDTVGASAVVLRDIDGDGLVDAVFSQERRAVNDYSVGSVLYWGSEEGFAAEPDLVFATVGASDVDAVDVNGDDRLDLVFASYRDASSTSTGSMVFLQDGTEGFCATAPDHLLPTKGARAVATGDIDGDGQVDLVFANSLAGGVAELDSYVYWGMAGGGFETTPLGLPTSGAQDVLVSDLNGDGDLDLAFANHWDNGLDPEVDSYVFLGDGTRDIGPSPDARLPTVGATGVAAADIDGSGWTDLVFANQRGPDSFMVPSYIYLGGAAGWPPAPDVELPTEGASSVLAVELIAYGTGGYLSQAVQIDEPARGTGTMHTLRYTATLGAAQSADLMVVDASTMEDLGRTPVTTGTHEWDLTGMFRVSEHRVVRIVVTAAGLEAPGQFSLDSIWFNWTERVEAPPVVVGLDTSAPSVLRTRSVTVLFDVTDEYDLPGDLVITVQERPTGSDTWSEGLVRDLSYDRASEAWTGTVTPKVDVPPGLYDIRVTARDLDGQISEWVEFPRALEVLNNLPTRPVVAITPEQALTTSSLVVEVTTRSMDVETTGLTYNYTWYRDGVPVPEVSGDGVPTYLTAKGENWTVEVRAWDGDGFSEAGTSSVVILNSPPVRRDVIPDPEIFEDTTDDEWIDLTNAFHDADGDPISWSLAREPVNVTVAIDHGSGRVTITPRPDWFGEEDVTFVGSDGEATASQTVTVVVLSVNDPPVITTIDGEPFKGKEYSYTINQGEPITITYSYSDVEGDEVQADVSIPTVDLDEASRTITFDPGTDAVGGVPRPETVHQLHHRGAQRERPHGGPRDQPARCRFQVPGQPVLLPRGLGLRPRRPVRPGAQLHLDLQCLRAPRVRFQPPRGTSPARYPPDHPHRLRRGVREVRHR